MASTQAAIEEANIIYCAIHSLSHPNSDKTITAINNALLLGVTQQDITDRVTMARNVNFQNMTYNPVTGGGSADMTANLSLLKNEIVNGNVICVVRRLGQPDNTAVRIPSLRQLLVPHMSLSDIYIPFAGLVKDSSHFLDLLYASVFFAYRNARSAFELGGGGSNFNTPGVQMDYSSVLTGNNPTHPIIPITQLLNSTHDPTAIGMAATQAANYTTWSADPLRPTAVNSLGNDYSQPPSANARLFDVYIQAQLKMERFPPLPLFRQRIGEVRYRQLESLFTRGSNWTRTRFEDYLTNLGNVYCIYAGNQLCARSIIHHPHHYDWQYCKRIARLPRRFLSLRTTHLQNIQQLRADAMMTDTITIRTGLQQSMYFNFFI